MCGFWLVSLRPAGISVTLTRKFLILPGGPLASRAMSAHLASQFRRSMGGLLAAMGMAVHNAGAAQTVSPLTPEVAGQVLERVLKLTLGKPQVAEWGRVRGAEAELPSWVIPVVAPVLVLEGNAWLVERHGDGSFDVVDATLRRRRFQPGAPADRIKGIEPGEWVPVAVASDQPRLDIWLGKKGKPGPFGRTAAAGYGARSFVIVVCASRSGR